MATRKPAYEVPEMVAYTTENPQYLVADQLQYAAGKMMILSSRECEKSLRPPWTKLPLDGQLQRQPSIRLRLKSIACLASG